MTSSTVAAAIAPVASANLVIAVARFATSIDAAQLDGAVIQAVKTNMLDTLSCALAGSSARPIAEVSGLVREWGGAPQADIFVFGHFSDEALQRADILELASRVKPYVDEEIDRDWRRFVTPGRVIVRFRDGQTLEARVDYPKGHPRNPIAEAELAAKTADCATFAATPLPADTATRLVSTTRQLESLADVSELVSVVTGGV